MIILKIAAVAMIIVYLLLTLFVLHVIFCAIVDPYMDTKQKTGIVTVVFLVWFVVITGVFHVLVDFLFPQM